MHVQTDDGTQDHTLGQGQQMTKSFLYLAGHFSPLMKAGVNRLCTHYLYVIRLWEDGAFLAEAASEQLAALCHDLAVSFQISTLDFFVPVGTLIPA